MAPSRSRARPFRWRRARRSSWRRTPSTASRPTSSCRCWSSSTARAARAETASRVFVTGATGFLGRHLVPLLAGRGDQVVALVRPRADTGWLGELGVRVVRGELLAGDARAAAEGSKLVFHLAGVVAHERRDRGRLLAVNVGGLRRVLEDVPRAARILHVSSVAAVGPAPGPDRPATEEQPFPEWALRYPYAESKRAAEQVALAAAGESRDVVVACPAFLLGPGDVYGISTWPVRRYLDGTLRIHEPGGLSHVDARDVAAGLVTLAERGRAGERTILANAEGNLAHAELFRRVAEVTGVRRRMVGLPPRVAALGATLVPWPVRPGEVRAAAHWWFYDPGKAARELGFRTRPIAETIRDTAAEHLSGT